MDVVKTVLAGFITIGLISTVLQNGKSTVGVTTSLSKAFNSGLKTAQGRA